MMSVFVSERLIDFDRRERGTELEEALQLFRGRPLMEDGFRRECQRPEVLGQHGLLVCSKIIVAFLCDMDIVRADDPFCIVGAVEGEAGPLVEGDNQDPVLHI